jgi:butyrate kinase
VKQYLRDHGHKENDVTAIVAHMGGGITVTLHRNGQVIDTNNGLGGDGPFTPERAGTCPAFPLIEMCFSGQYTESEVKKKILGKGGAVAYFGTNDLKLIEDRALAGDTDCKTFLDAYCLNIAKYIASEAATVEGKVDVILLTGGTANSGSLCEAIRRRVAFIAPVEVYAGEHELNSLAENGYNVLAGTVRIRRYDKSAIVPDED